MTPVAGFLGIGMRCPRVDAQSVWRTSGIRKKLPVMMSPWEGDPMPLLEKMKHFRAV